MSVTEQDAPAEAIVSASEAAVADRAGQPPADIAHRLTGAGFAAWFVPERFGGRGEGFEPLLDRIIELGQTCASTAWVASLLAFGGRYAACLPVRAQEDLWALGPDVNLVTVIKPQGRVVATDDGFELSGTWTYVSGVEFSDWAMLMAPGGPPDASNAARLFLVPRSDYTIERSWDSLGMRATGSHSLVLDRVVVPAHRTALRDDVMAGRGPNLPGDRHIPNVALNGITFVAPALGAVRGALEAARPHLAAPATGPRAFSRAAFQVEYGRASAECDTAELLLRCIAASADRDTITPALVLRNRRDATFALELLSAAADRCLRVSGTRGQDQGEAVQRFWRDVHSVASHAVMQFEPAGADYAEHLLEGDR